MKTKEVILAKYVARRHKNRQNIGTKRSLGNALTEIFSALIAHSMDGVIGLMQSDVPVTSTGTSCVQVGKLSHWMFLLIF